MPRNPALPIVFILLAIVFAVLAVLYMIGAINLLAGAAPHHYKHAAVSALLAVACLIAASFTRPQPV